MTQEVLLLKRALQNFFPHQRVSVRMKRAANYVDSSDKMLVHVSGATYRDVASALRQCTRNIKIAKLGECVSQSGNCEPYLLDVTNGDWRSADVCEFIEIQNGAE